MQGVNSKEFGRRVRELREGYGWSQTKLANLAGQSQSNIGWIEGGGPKDPRKLAIAFATALMSTPEWLLYGTGVRQTGPRILTVEQLKDLYKALPPEGQAAVTAVVEKFQKQKNTA